MPNLTSQQESELKDAVWRECVLYVRKNGDIAFPPATIFGILQDLDVTIGREYDELDVGIELEQLVTQGLLWKDGKEYKVKVMPA